jgi:hypothetical protein
MCIGANGAGTGWGIETSSTVFTKTQPSGASRSSSKYTFILNESLCVQINKIQAPKLFLELDFYLLFIIE